MKSTPGLLAIAAALAGCATTTLHENLLTNQQLIAADCKALAAEQVKIEQNAAHLQESAKGAAVGAAWLMALDAMSMQRGMANSGYQSSLRAADISDNNKAASAEMAQKAQLIQTLRARKNCA